MLETVTDDVFELVPYPSVTVSVTEYVPDALYVWLVVTPVPSGGSPNVQLYVAPDCAVELLPSKLHDNSEQLYVKFATGGVGPAVMNAVYSSRFGVPGPMLVIVFGVALFTSAFRVCSGVADGLAWR